METAGWQTRYKVAGSTALVFVVFATFFTLFRSSSIFTVDGATRCLEVFRLQTIFFHPNNHMLYPVDVLFWNHVIGGLGFRAASAEQYFAHTELMNCFAAAGCLAIFFYLANLVSSSLTHALGVVLAYGLSRAFLLHATSAAEPMVGILWSLLAMCFAVVALWRKSDWPIVVSALLFSLGMATYQSTIFLAPAAILLIWLGRTNRDGSRLFSPARFVELGEFTLTGVAGCALIFGWAYWREGFRHPRELVEHFFAHGDARAYLGVGIGKTLNIPIGLVRNIFPLLPDYTGIHNLLAGPKLSLVALLLVFGGLCAFMIVFAMRLAARWSSLSAEVQLGVVAATVGFVFTIVPVIIWDPNYDKLWLQPLACLAFLIGSGLEPIGADWKFRFWMTRAFPALLLVGVSLNLVWVARLQETKSPDIPETQRLADFVGRQDLVVGEWDAISTLYGYGWAKSGQFMSFPSEAVFNGIDSVAHLRDAVETTEKRGGRVYFLSILDEPRDAWDSFLGSRCGVPYAEFDSYRAHSKYRATFKTDHSKVVLKQYDPAYATNSSR
ncbi:MAG TPA: hypothetical protein VMI32_18990 [Candidatus Solibacter sp.]|nr:hypothetical protein [Candidatus Solibacter sp.]